MFFDEVIELQNDYDYKNNYSYENWKIIEKLKPEFDEEIIKQKEIERKELEEKEKIEQKEARKKVILVELWILKNEKDWMELIWEDTTEIDLKIKELKAEFISLKE
jgi:hypothetical protein